MSCAFLTKSSPLTEAKLTGRSLNLLLLISLAEFVFVRDGRWVTGVTGVVEKGRLGPADFLIASN